MSAKNETTKKEYKLHLAPMAGFTDRAMRLVCREHGADRTTTEMISAKAVVFGDKKTFSLAKVEKDEGPVALQIFGSEPDTMARAAEILSNPTSGVQPIEIDINMGCPVHKIFSNGEGSALMKSPELIERIVKAVKGACPLPVTVKLRSGVDEKSINAVECALAAEAGGASRICVHGRTRAQMYGGRSDPEIIKNVKRSVHIPVIANGDIRCGKDALDLLSATDADGVAIGRGAVGNPFIFSEIKALLEKREFCAPLLDERVECALKELSLAIEDKGERIAVPEARKKTALYFAGFRGAASLRAEINKATTFLEIEDLLKTIF